MIVKNEEDTLEKCLASVCNIVDEIIIVDTGSTDNTKGIARTFTNQVFDFEWLDDFSAARNFSFSLGNKEYIMWMDADDILLPEEQQKLIQLKRSLDSSVDAVSMQYHTAFDEYGNVVQNVRRFRLVKRIKNFQWEGAVHEDLIVKGKVMDSDIAITHRKSHQTTDRNLRIYENQLRQGKPFTLRDIFHYAQELHFHQMYEKAIDFYLKVLKNENSTIENKIFVCSKLADCYYQIGDKENEMYYIFKSFQYDIPRSEFCCRLGYHFLQKNELKQAIYWYKQAIQVPLPEDNWTVLHDASRTWLPHMQLGLCYYHLGQYDLSYQHNIIALFHRSDDERILNNITLLEERLRQKGTY